MFSLHKYISIANQIFSSTLFMKLLNKNEVINMDLKGWPFEPFGDAAEPDGPPSDSGRGNGIPV